MDLFYPCNINVITIAFVADSPINGNPGEENKLNYQLEEGVREVAESLYVEFFLQPEKSSERMKIISTLIILPF